MSSLVYASPPDWAGTPAGFTHHVLGHRRTPVHSWTGGRRRGRRYLVIPDAGHNANQDNPEAFNAALTRFLGRV